jgi:hypothetical protein
MMIHTKRFLDKVSLAESKQTKDIVLPIIEARGLRDEISKILADLQDQNSKKKLEQEVIKVEITGGKFK